MEERFRRTFEKAPIGIAMLGISERFLTVNERFAAIAGYEQRELAGRRLADLIHPDDAPAIEELNATFDVECRFLHKSGTTVWVHLTVTPVFGADEALDQIIVLANDVTEQRVAAQRMALQAQLLDSVEQAVIATDSSLRITYWNRHAEKLLGWRDAEALGRPLLDETIAPAMQPSVAEALTRVTRGESWSGETLIRRRSGEFCPVWVVAAPIRGNGSHPIGVVATFADISERRKLETKLEQANRLSSLGRLAATMAHEFNNVLMGIAPFVEVIRRTNARDRIDTALGQITQSIGRGKRITGEILRFSQTAEPVRAPIDVGEWLRAFSAEARSLLPPSCTLEVTSDEGLIIDGDVNQLHQTLINLVLNARDAMSGGGKLTIRATRDPADARFDFGSVDNPERFVHLSVADTGAGMTDEIRRHIFEPLFTTKKSGGTGLGLPLAHQVVARHGGEIFVETAPGTGTTFHLFLPAGAGAQAPRD